MTDYLLNLLKRNKYKLFRYKQQSGEEVLKSKKEAEGEKNFKHWQEEFR